MGLFNFGGKMKVLFVLFLFGFPTLAYGNGQFDMSILLAPRTSPLPNTSGPAGQRSIDNWMAVVRYLDSYVPQGAVARSAAAVRFIAVDLQNDGFGAYFPYDAANQSRVPRNLVTYQYLALNIGYVVSRIAIIHPDLFGSAPHDDVFSLQQLMLLMKRDIRRAHNIPRETTFQMQNMIQQTAPRR
jgi:hypothetical protein